VNTHANCCCYSKTRNSASRAQSPPGVRNASAIIIHLPLPPARHPMRTVANVRQWLWSPAVHVLEVVQHFILPRHISRTSFAAACVHAGHCARFFPTNVRELPRAPAAPLRRWSRHRSETEVLTNERTNKHDGSQYLLPPDGGGNNTTLELNTHRLNPSEHLCSAI